MRIDNHPILPDREPDPDEAEFWTKLSAAMVKALNMEELLDVVCVFRQLEAESIPRAGGDAAKTLEVKRHIAQSILTAGHGIEQSFEVCRDTWNALVELGFSNIEMLCSTAWNYANCCMHDAQYDVGLDVLNQVTAEIHRCLEEADLTKSTKAYYDGQLTTLGKLREGLVAHQTSEADGIAWQEREDAKYDTHDVHWMEREGRNQELHLELDRAIDSIGNASWSRSFAETAHDYRQLKADFVARLQGDDAFFVPEAKRRISATILMDAQKHHQPFEMCRELWNEIVECGFASILQECALAWFYADCCLVHGQADAGLAALEPRIAKLQEHDYGGMDTDTLESYQEGRARLEKLRDKLGNLRRDQRE